MANESIEPVKLKSAEDFEPITIEQILADLDDGWIEVPYAAIRAARQRREEIIPRLIGVLQDTAAKWQPGEIPEGYAFWRGMYLIAEFRAQEALPAIIEAMSLPGDLLDDLFDRIIGEELSRVLFSLGVDLETLSALIDNGHHNLYMRWTAASTVLQFAAAGEISRAEAVERLRRHLRTAIDRHDGDSVTFLVLNLSELWPDEARTDLREAFDRDLVDSFLIAKDEVESALAAGEEGMRAAWRDRRPPRITDSIAEFEHMRDFDEFSADEDEFSTDEEDS